MPDKSIFITGASGFVGNAVLDELLQRQYRVHALVRESPIERDGVRSFVGDLFDDKVLDAAMRGCAAAIHLVGIIRENPSRGQTFERIHYEGSRNVFAAAERTGVKRFIQMSALGSRTGSPSAYASTKARAEEALKQTQLDYTIFRPSVIHGAEGEFMEMLAGWAQGEKLPWLFMPYFANGLVGQKPALLQPVYVKDVARAFVDAIEKPELIRETIDLVGPQQFTWPAMYRIASQIIRGKTKMALGIPVWYARLLTQISPAFLLPFNRAQVEMASEDSTADPDTISRHFGWNPEPFADALRGYKAILHGKK